MESEFVRCPDCGGQLLPSGVEVHRRICKDCGNHYHAVLQFVRVAPRAEGLLTSGADSGTTSKRRD